MAIHNPAAFAALCVSAKDTVEKAAVEKAVTA
jgi:hypothetical protein